MSTPIALWLAEKLEDPESAHGYRLVANNAADELRRLQQENEQLKAQRKPLTDEQVNLFINGRGDEGDDDYVEPTGDGFGLTDADLVRLVRRVEAAHGIKENT